LLSHREGLFMSIRVGINGFGRIGRLFYRIATEHPQLEIVAVNDLVPADNLAYLLKYDTMHGRMQVGGKTAEVSATENSFTVNGRPPGPCREGPGQAPVEGPGRAVRARVAPACSPSSRRPAAPPAGAKRVLISAPTKSAEQVPTFCMGVNESKYDPARHNVISNAPAPPTAWPPSPRSSTTASASMKAS
jgi:glyceraldehyde 3-phosphate dehydrogenase